MKKIVLLLGATFIGSLAITKVGLDLIESNTISNELETDNDKNDSENNNNNDNLIPSDELLEEYKKELRKVLEQELKEENDEALSDLEEKIKKELEENFKNGNFSYDDEILNNIKNTVKDDILNNIKNNIKDSISNEIKDEILENNDNELSNLVNATLDVGNNISVAKDDFNGAMENVIATDYDGTNITDDVNYKIMEYKNNQTFEVDNFDGDNGLGGNFSVIYYVTGKNNESVIGYKNIDIYVPIDIKLYSNLDEFIFTQNINLTQDAYSIPKLDEIIDSNIVTTSGTTNISWDIDTLRVDKDEVQEITINIVEVDRVSNNAQLVIKFVPSGHIYEGDGSLENPFQIQNTTDFEYLQGKDINANFIITSDLDFANSSSVDSIGVLNKGFDFNGNKKIIKNITLGITQLRTPSYPTGDYGESWLVAAYSGLFKEILGEFHDINIENVEIEGRASSSHEEHEILINIIAPYILGDRNLYRVDVKTTLTINIEFIAEINAEYIRAYTRNALYSYWDGEVVYMGGPDDIFGEYCIDGAGSYHNFGVSLSRGTC